MKELWWQPSFNRTGGDQPEQTIAKLSPGETKTLVFELKAVASAADIIQTQEENELQYSFKVGEHVFHRKALVNQARISIGASKPAVWLEISPSTTSPAVGENATLTLTVFNRGAATAFNVTVIKDDKKIATIDKLLPDETKEITHLVTSSSVTTTSDTLLFVLEWTEEGATRSVISNSIQLNYRFDTPRIPTLQIVKRVQIPPADSKMVNVTVIVSNLGPWRLTNLNVKDILPKGISYVNGSFTAVNQELTATIEDLGKQQNRTLRYSANLTTRTENFVIFPAEVSVKWTSATLRRVSEGASFPIAVGIQKQYSRTFGFTGGSIQVNVDLRNQGSLGIFDVNLRDPSDTFLNIVKGNATATKDTINQGDNLTLRYEAKLSSVGNFTASRATASFIFAGQSQSVSSTSIPVVTFDVPSASLSVEPREPVENRPFTLTITVHNPSNLTISDLDISINIPDPIEGPKEALNIRGETLPGKESLSKNASFKSGRALDTLIQAPLVSFKFDGETFSGKSSGLVVSLADDLTNRYGIPISIALGIALLAAFYARRITYRAPIKTT